MKTTAFVLSLACVFSLTFQRMVSAQKAAPGIAGKWDVTIRMPDKSVSELWTIQQKGGAITATAKGERELPVSGSIDAAFLRVTVTDGTQQYKVRATVDGDAMDGSITYGKGKEYLWHAKRSTAK
jgi:hypothetical protein